MLQYIMVHNDAIPNSYLQVSAIRTEGMSRKEILKEVENILDFQEKCIEDPSVIARFYGEEEINA